MPLLVSLTRLLQKTYFCEQSALQKPLSKYKPTDETETSVCVYTNIYPRSAVFQQSIAVQLMYINAFVALYFDLCSLITTMQLVHGCLRKKPSFHNESLLDIIIPW